MFGLRQTSERRDALVKTARQLVKAPDAYAKLRVESDLLLMQLAIAKTERKAEWGTDQKAQESAALIARFADRYRSTPAEARSLIMAATLAFDKGNVILLDAFRKALTTRFSDDPQVIAFMRERFAKGSQVRLSGEFKRADGKVISFPMGRTYLACFWSRDTPLLKEKIAEIKHMQDRYKGAFNVYSFNLDDLADAGESSLKRLELDWTPMRLPGGEGNPTFVALGGANSYAALVIGPHGLATRSATGKRRQSLHKVYEAMVRSPRHASLLRSLCIGDYLVTDSAWVKQNSSRSKTLNVLLGSFPSPAERYRLSTADELKMYAGIVERCKASAGSMASPDPWRVLNVKTVAQLGLWRMTGESQYLDQAARTAKTAVRMDLPLEARVIPRFALTSETLMNGGDDADTREILKHFITTTGGEHAPASAHAAALTLALEAHSRRAYETYRDTLLDEFVNDPTVSRVVAFLLEPSCAARLFEGALPTRRGEPDAAKPTERTFTANWKRINGKQVALGTGKAVTAIVFMEAMADRRMQESRKRFLDRLIQVADTRQLKDFNVVVAYRSDDPERVAKEMKRNKGSIPAVALSEDEWNRCERAYGVFSADKRPNAALIGPDGKILLGLSGVSPDTMKPDAMIYRIKAALREYALALADKALDEKNDADYAAHLAEAFPLMPRRQHRHYKHSGVTSAHGRLLTWAYMQAKDWERALESANANIALQVGKPNPKDKAAWCRTCYGHLYDMAFRVHLLRKADKKKEAAEALALMHIPKCPHGKRFDPIWQDIEAYIVSRTSRRRFRHLKDPARYLKAREYQMRSGQQNLYGFSIQSDLMMRATIHEKLGNLNAAKVDRMNAAVRSWPFKVREYHPDLLHEASVKRRARARKAFEAKDWNTVFRLANRNIEIHESEGKRCNSMCKICWAQVQSFGFRIRTLEALGRKKEADANRAMMERCKCPPGKDLESYKCFPVNRMYGGGAGVNRLNYIDTVMKGENPYCNKRHRSYRMEFAADLVLRAEALEKLGKSGQASADRNRATALAFPAGAKAAAFSALDEGPARYEDLVSGADE